MDLPRVLRERLDDALAGVSAAELRAAAARLSNRYRGEVHDGRTHLDGEQAVFAYAASRLPATYAATRAALNAIVIARPDFAPKAALDLGAGPGTGLWALADCWPEIEQVTLIEQSPAARILGEQLASGGTVPKAVWRSGDIGRAVAGENASDIVLLGYVLGEIVEAGRLALTERAWALALDTLLIVEPGTSAGWARLMTVRQQLLALGAHVLAPCPHSQDCPLVPPDWCHFAERIPRSRLHREIKGGELGWEDEKFIYLAASRHKSAVSGSRIIARPLHARGRVSLKLCNPDGHATETIISRRDGDLYKRASRADWG
ncbi:MAG: small ribosomal subunit Rsm22 family protein, partial [Alphaproteobacteria bacterium]